MCDRCGRCRRDRHGVARAQFYSARRRAFRDRDRVILVECDGVFILRMRLAVILVRVVCRLYAQLGIVRRDFQFADRLVQLVVTLNSRAVPAQAVCVVALADFLLAARYLERRGLVVHKTGDAAFRSQCCAIVFLARTLSRDCQCCRCDAQLADSVSALRVELLVLYCPGERVVHCRFGYMRDRCGRCRCDRDHVASAKCRCTCRRAFRDHNCIDLFAVSDLVLILRMGFSVIYIRVFR